MGHHKEKQSEQTAFSLYHRRFERALIKQSCGLFLARSVDEPIVMPNKAGFEMNELNR